jgi:3-hydroxyacyl-[acyl-carrier-protein] dehydratase
VAGKDLLIDPSLFDFDNVIADIDEIRRYNPQRFEMEQLSAVIYEDLDEFACRATRILNVTSSGCVATCPICP